MSLNDEWEILYLKFSIFTGENDDAKEVFLDLKMQEGDQLKPMAKVPRGKAGWMKAKYGKNVVPWECTVQLGNTNGDKFGQWKDSHSINYRYKKVSSLHNQQAERDPWRVLNIEDPAQYRGQLGDNGTSEQRYSDQVFSVNAYVDKVDGNLISEFFIYQIDGNNSIYAGSYPSNSNEVHLIVKQGVQSVLNL